MKSIRDDKVKRVLVELHKKAKMDRSRAMQRFPKKVNFLSLSPKKKSELMKEFFLAVDEDQGDLLFTLAKGSKAKSIFEFGTSFGISTIYLGLAAKENKGKVFTTELNRDKCLIAKENIEKAGLGKVIKVIEGDALESLSTIKQRFDFVFLDGWKEMYLPILKKLESKLKKGAIIIADNVSMKETIPYLNYLKANKKYVTTTLKMGKDDTEITFLL